MRIRLNREENGSWIEKAAITRIWLSTSDVHAENALEQLRQMFDMILHESNYLLSAPATHAAQTLLWKKVEETSAQEHHCVAESWCRLCLHPLFERAGAQNKVKITRCVISVSLSSRHAIADLKKKNYPICTLSTRLYSCARCLL
jgi:hypothetical protein